MTQLFVSAETLAHDVDFDQVGHLAAHTRRPSDERWRRWGCLVSPKRLDVRGEGEGEMVEVVGRVKPIWRRARVGQHDDLLDQLVFEHVACSAADTRGYVYLPNELCGRNERAR